MISLQTSNLIILMSALGFVNFVEAAINMAAQPESTTYDFERDGMECTWNAKVDDKKIKGKGSVTPYTNITEKECKVYCQTDTNCKSISIRDTITTKCKPKTVNKLTSPGDYEDATSYIYYDFTCVTVTTTTVTTTASTTTTEAPMTTVTTTASPTAPAFHCIWNEQVDGYKLAPNSIKKKKNVTIEQCKQLCQDTNSCKSFEYKHTIKRCQLNNETKDTKAEDYKADVNFYYYDYSCEDVLPFYKNKSGDCAGQNVGTVSVVTLEKCAEECWKLGECDSFVFHGDSTDDPANNCYLKKPQLETLCPVPTQTSSVVTTFHLNTHILMNTEHTMVFSYYMKVSGNCPGNNITTKVIFNEEECAFECWKHKSCESFVYFFNTNECVLKYPIMKRWCFETEENVYAYSYYGKWFWEADYIIKDYFIIQSGDCVEWHEGQSKTDISDTQCATICWNTPSCDGFVFSYNADETRGCYIRCKKKECYQTVYKAGFFTYRLNAKAYRMGRPVDHYKYFESKNGDCPGSFAGYKPHLTKEECAIICFNNYNCDGFVYSCNNTDMPGCHLKMPNMTKWCGAPIPKENYVSYFIKVGGCASNPCNQVNTKKCYDQRGGRYMCYCHLGYEGENCDDDRDDCKETAGFVGLTFMLNIPKCNNGGTCIDMVDGFKCNCPDGYMGTACANRVPSCQHGFCENNSTCEQLEPGQVKCHCGEEYLGITCQTWKKPCESNPCLDSEQCSVDSEGHYYCMPTGNDYNDLFTTNPENTDREEVVPGVTFYEPYTGKLCTWKERRNRFLSGDMNSVGLFTGVSRLHCKQMCETDYSCSVVIHRQSCLTDQLICYKIYESSNVFFIEQSDGFNAYYYLCKTDKRSVVNQGDAPRLRRSLMDIFSQKNSAEISEKEVKDNLLQNLLTTEMNDIPEMANYNPRTQEYCMTSSEPSRKQLCVTVHSKPVSHSGVFNMCKFFRQSELIIESSAEAMFIESLMKKMSIPAIWAKFSPYTGYMPYESYDTSMHKCVLFRAYDYIGPPTEFTDCQEKFPYLCESIR